MIFYQPPKIYLTAQSGNVSFEKNLNIDLMKASKIEFLKGQGTAQVKGAIQLIVSSVNTFANGSIDILKSLNPTGGFYHIINTTGVDDLIGLTETKGKYKINTDRYDVTATDADGTQTKAKDGYLTLAKSGEYVITAIKEIENPTYYVSSSGSSKNTGLTKDSPFLTVGDAILAARTAGYWGGDTVTVRVLSSSVEWGATYSGKNDGSDKKALERKRELYGHEYKLVVCSDDVAKKSTVKIPNLMPMLGDVEFDNVIIPKMETFASFDDSVTMTETVSFNPNYMGIGFKNKSNTVEEELDFVLKNQFNGYINLTNTNWANKKFDKDVTVTINNKNSTPKFSFVLYWGGNTTFNGNLNIDVQNAKSVVFGEVDRPKIGDRSAGKATVNKAVHVIVNSKTEMDSASITNLEGLSPSGKFYHISNNSGICDLVSFTQNAGEFKINPSYENYVVTAVDGNGNATVSSGGYIKLTKPGYYSFSAQNKVSNSCTSHQYTNACDAMCNVCGATRKITHNFKYSCSVACLTCGIKRSKIYHSRRETPYIIPATETKNGENWEICELCNQKLELFKIIYKITKYEVTPNIYNYDGKTKTPKIRICDAEGIRLEEDWDYTLSYPKNRKNPGVYKVKVQFRREYSGTKYLTFTIKPPKTSVKSISGGDKRLKVSVKKNSKASGYEIQYSTSKKFTNAKIKTISSYKKTSTTIKGLKAQKNYYVRVRTYKKVGGQKIYSNWSKALKKKTKGVYVAESKISKITALKKGLKVSVKKTKKVKGYQIQYSTSSKFSKAKTKTVKGYKKTTATLKKLKSNKTYFVRVRTFKLVGKKKHYSDWSASKTMVTG